MYYNSFKQIFYFKSSSSPFRDEKSGALCAIILTLVKMYRPIYFF
jgi:hypothetical protein